VDVFLVFVIVVLSDVYAVVVIAAAAVNYNSKKYWLV
jgi:hypothetical protein